MQGHVESRRWMLDFRVDHVDRWRTWTVLMHAGSIGALILGLVGLPRVDLHGPTHYVGIMDPLCGMTRAVRSLAVGDLSGAWRYNPASFALAGSALLAGTRALIGAATGRWFTVQIRKRSVWILAGLAFVIALEINQQSHVALLVRR